MLHFPPRLSPVVKTTGNPRWVREPEVGKD